MILLNIDIKQKIFPLKTKSIEKQNVIFKNLNFNISNGEFACIFGPSGCGKTTLLNIISGLDNQYRGQINLNGIGSKNKISYLFQSPRLFPWMTVAQNVAFPIKKEKNSKKIALNLIKQVGMEKFANSFPNKLSGGMRKRISLARSFSNNPSILLLDEPFISLDKKSAVQLRNFLINLWKKNKPTIIFVTHDLDEAIELSDRIIFLSNSPAKILLDYKIKIKRPRKKYQKAKNSLKRLLSASVIKI